MMLRREFLIGALLIVSGAKSHAFGQLGSLGLGFGRLGSSRSSFPAPPAGFVYLLGADGAYLKGADGAYLLGVAP